MIRYLRIIVCVLCVLASVSLVALWVRSYKTADRLHGRIWYPKSFLIASKEGRVSVILLRWHGAENWWRWHTESYPVDDELSFPVGRVRQYEAVGGFGWIDRPLYMVMRSTQTLPDGSEIMVMGAATATLQGAGPIIPYWFLVSLTIALAAIARVRWPPRFSMLGLFLAVAIVAIILALASVLDRQQQVIHPPLEIHSFR